MRAAVPPGPAIGLDRMVQNLNGALIEGFSTSDASHQKTIRQQLMHRDRSTSEGFGLVLGFSPGNTFELLGHPTLGADGEYLLTKLHHSSVPFDADSIDGRLAVPEGTNYQNRFECQPLEVQWRPDRVTPKPRIYGIQTARVTGPVGMDVYTDQHGRIRVKFSWDRSDLDASGNYTCWLRVSQTWAGQGSPGFIFIPRVGMEVIVAFLDGDPDRPLVTGCVYNGENATPGLLPVQATKSIIRTRTVPHGPGHNELSFEDAMGIERVHLRAQRDLDELVLNDHVTRVRRNQTNEVGKDQVENIRRHQRLLVNGHRYKHVHGNQSENTSGNQLVRTAGAYRVTAGKQYHVSVTHGGALVEAPNGQMVLAAKHDLVLEQNEARFIEMASDGDNKGIFITADGGSIHLGDKKIMLKVGASEIELPSSLSA